jgi:hypothetical protein
MPAFLERRHAALFTSELCPASSLLEVSEDRNLVSVTDLVFVMSRFL